MDEDARRQDFYDRRRFLQECVQSCNEGIGQLITDEIAEAIIEHDKATGELSIWPELKQLVEVRASRLAELNKMSL